MSDAPNSAGTLKRPDPWLGVFSEAPERRMSMGTNLFLRGDRVGSAFLVRSGRIALERTLEGGGELTVHVAVPGECVAQASLFAERYHCDGVCRTDVTVAIMPKGKVLERLTRVGALSALASSAHEVQALRSRIEVLRLRRLADRLDAYDALFGPPEPGGWVRVADWIGVTPPALYRELARRRMIAG